MVEFIGILPAAGVAARLRPFRYPKELLPVVFVSDSQGGLRPKLTIEFAIEALRTAHVRHSFVVIADWKLEIVRLLGDGNDLGVSLAYLHRAVPKGLADAVDAGFEWFCGRNVCLALPDSIFTPPDAIAKISQSLQEHDADLVLGVFPTFQPERLGPVRFASDGQVLEVLEKPAQTTLFNTWGIAAWAPSFSAFLHQTLNRSDEARTQSIGHMFNAAVLAGMRVRSVFFEGGSYTDAGMVDTIGSLVLKNEAQTETKIEQGPK
ncbi:MAG TPA: sugar phosphate nucleotidyltransferase [Pseudomonadota bacterium]|nr:sugar phosphate nucleotidyltransferase [Pseudomonadota bacterium]